MNCICSCLDRKYLFHCRQFVCYFVGVQAGCILGETQLYSLDKKLTQCIHTHSVLLTSYLFEGNRLPTTVLCAAGRDTVDHSIGKVCL